MAGLDDLFATNLYFKRLFDLIPPNAYFDTESNQKLLDHKSDNSDEKAISKLSRNPKHKAKRVKFDPTQNIRTSEIQQILPTLAQSTTSPTNNHTPNGVGSGTSSSSSDVISPNDDDFGASAAAASVERVSVVPSGSKSKDLVERTDCVAAIAKRSRKFGADQTADTSVDSKTGKHISDNDSSVDSSPFPASSSTKLNSDQLREKLRARILELQSKRQHGMTAEEFLESKKLRRKQSKLKLKQKRKEAKKLKLSVEKQAKNSQHKLNGVSEVDPSSEAKSKAADNNKMVFSKFQFSEQAKKPKDRKLKKSKSYKELYDKVIKDKAQLEELKQTDAEKAKKTAEKNAWRKAMDQSKGVKVKDNPELLKKSMKKEEKLKQRSQKKWEERTTSVAEQQQKRQVKRKKNILAKKQTKIDRKVKLAKKKGRIVSGF